MNCQLHHKTKTCSLGDILKTLVSTLLAISSVLFSTTSIADSSNGIINFNLGQSPVSDSPVQPVSLFGCNTVVNSDLFWGSENQVVGDIPYGPHTSESGKDYIVSKYYIASPPAFRKGSKPNSKKQQPFIGLVTPDRFSFTGKKPAQIVYFNYRILKPTYLTFVTMDYHHQNTEGDTCKSLGADLIPVNTQCSDFPWRNGAQGASGIGDMTQKNNLVFLPLVGHQQKPLQCDVTIIDDIILDYDIYFEKSDGSKSKTASLTKYHNADKAMKLICYKRAENDIPIGCR